MMRRLVAWAWRARFGYALLWREWTTPFVGIRVARDEQFIVFQVGPLVLGFGTKR